MVSSVNYNAANTPDMLEPKRTMLRISSFPIAFFLAITFLSIMSPQLLAQGAFTTGPEKGSLVIVGGGGAGEEILRKFIELSGGAAAKIVVIPTAGGRATYSQDAGVAKALRNLGAKDVQVFHTDDPAQANLESFIAPLEKAGGLWFGGGRQWRLVDAYAGTRAEQLFWEVFKRGGAIGGSSAGATLLELVQAK